MKKLSHGCTLDCFDACKFNIYTKDEEIIKIEGDKEHPYTKGFICKKGMSHLERLNHKDRILKPLLKVNGVWKEITFIEAVEIFSEKLKYYKSKYSSKSVLYYEQYGNGALLKSIGDIFFNFYGGVTKQKGGPCWSAGINAQKYDFGDVISHSLEDMLNSKSIFIWGKNPAYTTIHTMKMIHSAKKQGVKIVVIDPMYTKTAKMADKYIRVNPGCDGALALAIAKLIIDLNLYDKEYTNTYVKGFDEYKKYIDTLKLDYLSSECGVCLEDIKELVKIYTNKYSTILIGYGMQKYFNGGNTVRLIDSLGAITGQIGFSGGGVNYANRVYPNILNLDPYNSYKYAQNREFYVSNISKFLKNPLKYSESEKCETSIKMGVIVKSNLLNQLPSLHELEKSFKDIEFKVCFDMFMTDTAKMCDLFIPTTSTLESEDLLFSSMTNPYLIYNQRVIKPKEMLMDEYYFFREVAKKLDLNNYPYVCKKEYLSEVIKPLKKLNNNISLEWLVNNYFTPHNPVAWSNKVFKTKSKKYELYSNDLKYIGQSPIPIYKSHQIDKGYRLVTTHHKDTLFSQHYLEVKGMSCAYINEKIALEKNIVNDEVVILKSKNYSITTKIVIDNSVCDNVVKMYVGWWKKHGNPNYIIESEISDMGGQVAYHETFIDIIKQK